MFFEFYTGAR